MLLNGLVYRIGLSYVHDFPQKLDNSPYSRRSISSYLYHDILTARTDRHSTGSSIRELDLDLNRTLLPKDVSLL